MNAFVFNVILFSLGGMIGIHLAEGDYAAALVTFAAIIYICITDRKIRQSKLNV